ncbi:MAG: glycogen/starch synthase [Alphaproteobacteria bacterium]|nr:glycogen/starch synthase [Alphaproteobacteria bacterium]
MHNKKRVLFILTEMSPFIELSEMSEFIGRLVSKVSISNCEVRCIMPRFGIINERRYKLHEVVRLSGINIAVDEDEYYLQIKVATVPNARIQIYFLENEDFFKRKTIDRDENDVWFEDNDIRTIFFCKGALEIVKKFAWAPDIIYCNGWMTSLIPLYIKTAFKREPVFSNSKVVYSVSDIVFSEKIGKHFIKKILINEYIKKDHITHFKTNDNVGLQLGGIHFADAVAIHTNNLHLKVKAFLKKKSDIPIIEFENWDSDLVPYIDLFNEIAVK